MLSSSSRPLMFSLLLPVWGTSFSQLAISLHLLSLAVVWNEFLGRDGGGHWTQVSQIQCRGCGPTSGRNWLMVFSVHVRFCFAGYLWIRFTLFFLHMCVIVYLGTFWILTGSAVTVAISTLDCFSSASPCFLFISLTLTQLCRGQQRICVFSQQRQLCLLLLLLCFLAMVVFSVTAKLIIGLVYPASTGLIAANSLSRCISPHAHMEEIKPAKLIETPNILFLFAQR